MPKGVFPRISAEQRFWTHVQKGPGCWEWQAGRKLGKHRYGKFKMNRKTIGAHRVAWEFEKGPVPEGLCVLHHCDNPPCVRPDHLWIGTNLDNIKDRDAKNRQAKGASNGSRLYPERLLRGERHPNRLHPERLSRGSSHYNAKLTEEQVREIRRLHATGQYGYHSLAVKFGMGSTPIASIVNRKSWKHI
ncbi:MAG: HNH endonuclease [Elusimicrobia bacterium]|nr:HNH endonuclease [Elusimicrobiota bacterium]